MGRENPGVQIGLRQVDLTKRALTLMNHALPSGDVTMGYQRPSLEHLRACQEKVTAFLLGRIGAEGVSSADGIRA